MIYFSDTELLGLKIGDTDISAVYAGDLLIYPTTVTAWSVTPSQISMATSGGTEKIKIASLSAWTISSSESWITFSQNSGDSGRTTVIATIANNTETARTATITVTDGTNTSTISVSQTGLAFSVAPTNITVLPTGDTQDITISSPYSWTISSSESWITFSQDSGSNGTYTIVATIAANEGETDRTATITVDNGYEYSAITVSQRLNYSQMPLTFEITSNGKITWCSNNNSSTKTIEYSKNSGEWTQITSTTSGTQINVSAGDILQFRGNNDVYSTSGTFNNNLAGGIANHIVYGNIMSLVDSTGYTATTSISANAFEQLFIYDTSMTDASNLILPATTLASYCYYQMFYACNHLTAAPELPATTLANNCYRDMFQYCSALIKPPIICATTLAENCCRYMFRDCTSLTTAPELPATTLATYCYAYMFSGCTSLTTAPELPAPTLVTYCYSQMFRGCSKLNYIKCLATSISASNCKANWVYGVASSGTFVKAAGISESTWTRGVDGIPTNWTVVDNT